MTPPGIEARRPSNLLPAFPNFAHRRNPRKPRAKAIFFPMTSISTPFNLGAQAVCATPWSKFRSHPGRVSTIPSARFTICCGSTRSGMMSAMVGHHQSPVPTSWVFEPFLTENYGPKNAIPERSHASASFKLRNSRIGPSDERECVDCPPPSGPRPH